MFRFLRFVFFGSLALLALIPAGIVLAVVGLPVMAVLGLLALPVLLVLFLLGFPLFIVLAVCVGLISAVLGVVLAFLSMGAVVLKLAFVVLVPLLVVGWVLRRLFAPTDQLRAGSW